MMIIGMVLGIVIGILIRRVDPEFNDSERNVSNLIHLIPLHCTYIMRLEKGNKVLGTTHRDGDL